MKIPRLILLMLLGFLAVGCSRSQKWGGSISPQAVSNAIPEFTFILPPGGKNVFLDQRKEPIPMVYYKVTVPRASVSNFLYASNIRSHFIPLPAAAAGALQSVPLPQLSASGMAAWSTDMNNAAEWDVGRKKAPLRMTGIETSANTVPNARVVLVVYVDDSNSDEAPIYFQYFCISKDLLTR